MNISVMFYETEYMAIYTSSQVNEVCDQIAFGDRDPHYKRIINILF